MTTDTAIARTIHTTANGTLIYCDSETRMSAAITRDGLHLSFIYISETTRLGTLSSSAICMKKKNTNNIIPVLLLHISTI